MSEELHLDELEMVSRIGMATHPRVVGQLVDRLRAAEAEVARLTAVVQGVREELIATRETQIRALFSIVREVMEPNGYRGQVEQKLRNRLRDVPAVLAGGTDTPKEAETNGDV